MATPLTMSTDLRDDGTVVLKAAGELDLSNISAFSEAIADARKASADSRLSIDLSRVEYLDSGAINVLFNYAEGTRVVVNPILLPVLKISGLTEVAAVETADLDGQ